MRNSTATGQAYQRAGNGPTLVLVHGYLGGSGMWKREIAKLGPRYDVIAPDLAGFGASAALTAPDSIEGHANMLLELLDSLGVGSFHLLGHSMGGMIAQQMALQAHDRLGKLVLYGTGPTGNLPDRFETIAASRLRVSSDGVPSTARRIAATWFVEGTAAAGYPVCEAEGVRASLQAALASLAAWEKWDIRALLPTIQVPTLVIWGEHDRSIRWQHTEMLWRNIPGCSLAVVPACAHNVHMENPEIFDLLLEGFLSR